MIQPFTSTRLGDQDVASIILGQSPPSSVYNNVGAGLPFFQGKVDFQRLHPIPRVWCTQGRKFAAPGDILISVRAPVGDVNVATDRCAIGRGIAAIRPGSRSDPWFLYFALLYVKPILESRATGSTFASVNKTTLNDLDIPLFDLSEQTKIGKFLHSLICKIEQEDEALNVAQILKHATMQRLFTRGLRDEAQKETEIGPMPESWRTATLGELCEILSGGTPRKSVSEFWGGSIPWVSGKDLKLPSLSDSIDHVTDEGVQSGTRLVPKGSVLLLVRGMGLAKDLPVAVINRPMTFNQDIKALISRGDYSGSFIRSAIYTSKERMLNRAVTSAHGTMTLNLNDVENFQIPYPLDPSERDKIVEILDTIDQKTNLHRRKYAVLEELFKALLHKLMTREIRMDELNLTGMLGARA